MINMLKKMFQVKIVSSSNTNVYGPFKTKTEALLEMQERSKNNQAFQYGEMIEVFVKIK